MSFWQFKNVSENEAELYIYGEIVSEEPWYTEDYTDYRNFVSELNSLGNKNKITVFINSGGGDVYAACCIYNKLRQNKAKIKVVIEGLCASAATIIAMAADKGKLYTSKSAMIMLHNPKIGLNGFFENKELEKYMEITEKVKSIIVNAYLNRLNKTEKELDEIMNNETWYTGTEAVNEGLADKITDNKYKGFIDERYVVINNVANNIENYKHFKEKFEQITPMLDKEHFFYEENKSEKHNIEFKNAEELKSAYPAFINELVNNVVKKERQRLKEIDDISFGLLPEEVEKAKYETFETAKEIAYKALKENKIKSRDFFNNCLDDNRQSGTQNVITFLDEDNKPEKSKGLSKFLNKDKRRNAK